MSNTIATVRNEDIGGLLLVLLVALSFGARVLFDWMKDAAYYRARTIVRKREEVSK